MDDLIDIPKATSKCAHGTVAATPPVPVLTEPLG
jgi:hypothetical protein